MRSFVSLVLGVLVLRLGDLHQERYGRGQHPSVGDHGGQYTMSKTHAGGQPDPADAVGPSLKAGVALAGRPLLDLSSPVGIPAVITQVVSGDGSRLDMGLLVRWWARSR